MAKRQTRIPGTEDPASEEIEEAAEAYVEARDARMKLTLEETEKHDVLLELMDEHNRQSYFHGDVEVIVKPGQRKAKVKIRGKEAEED